ncbi:hypothetical protein ACJX0J_014526, partial [Zea mays]
DYIYSFVVDTLKMCLYIACMLKAGSSWLKIATSRRLTVQISDARPGFLLIKQEDEKKPANMNAFDIISHLSSGYCQGFATEMEASKPGRKGADSNITCICVVLTSLSILVPL